MHRVLVVAPGDPSRPHSGDVDYALEMYKILRKFTSASLFYFPGHNYLEPRYRVYARLPIWLLSYFKRLITFSGIVYIVNHSGIALFTLISGKAFNRRIRVLPYIDNPDWDNLLGRFVAMSSDAVCINNFTVENFRRTIVSLAKSYCFLPGRVVHPDSIGEIWKKRVYVKGKIGIVDNTIAVGLIGPFHTYNKPSLRYLVQNLDKFSENITFKIIGSIDTGDKFNHPRLVYTGHIEDYYGTLAALDCVLIPRFVKHASPMGKMVDAMAVGVPVVTNELEELPLVNGENVLLGSLNELPELVNHAVSEKETARRIGENGRKFILQNFSAEGVTMKLERFINSI